MIIEEISIKSKQYPEKLRNIYDPPQRLYILGNKEILNKKGIAIIGSRNCTEYGKSIALKFSSELIEKGYNIISGLALGIDTYAHMGCIDKIHTSKTIAVLGSGLDKIYPSKNIELAKKIIKSGGCIVSEYKIGTSPAKLNFPQRNRIISGLADGILIVEASKKSGALITADFALEQGKEVFAVPGNINNTNSYGTNELIKQGAKLVTNVNDILEEVK